MSEIYLVTGGMGCLGAWTLKNLVEAGKKAISFDLSDKRHRLDLLLEPEKQAAITFEQGDLSDMNQVKALFERHAITRVIHLAALQIPFCRANPVLGAQVNVVGTVNIFEAVRLAGLSHLAYASSVAVYGPPQNYPSGLIAEDAPFDPQTLYGVYKQSNEGLAKIYWQENQISSTALRPYTVYGVGRDQGMTSEPTKAMLAAAAGQDFEISFGGTMQFHYAADVANHFIQAAETPLAGAFGFNLGSPPQTVSEVARLIMKLRPQVKITVQERDLPFPHGFDNSELKRHLRVEETPLEQGILQTIEHFERALAEGRLAPS